MSARHYFHNFVYCESGMIPLVLVAVLMSCSGRSLGDWVKDRFASFPSSGETNFLIEDGERAIDKVLQAYQAEAVYI